MAGNTHILLCLSDKVGAQKILAFEKRLREGQDVVNLSLCDLVKLVEAAQGSSWHHPPPQTLSEMAANQRAQLPAPTASKPTLPPLPPPPPSKLGRPRYQVQDLTHTHTHTQMWVSDASACAHITQQVPMKPSAAALRAASSGAASSGGRRAASCSVAFAAAATDASAVNASASNAAAANASAADGDTAADDDTAATAADGVDGDATADDVAEYGGGYGPKRNSLAAAAFPHGPPLNQPRSSEPSLMSYNK